MTANVNEISVNGVVYVPKNSEIAQNEDGLQYIIVFPIAVNRVELLQAIEILNCTSKAKKSIEGIPTWKQ